MTNQLYRCPACGTRYLAKTSDASYCCGAPLRVAGPRVKVRSEGQDRATTCADLAPTLRGGRPTAVAARSVQLLRCS